MKVHGWNIAFLMDGKPNQISLSSLFSPVYVIVFGTLYVKPNDFDKYKNWKGQFLTKTIIDC